MVDGWPMDTNDDAAKNEWGWKPFYNLDNGLNYILENDYIINTNIINRPININNGCLDGNNKTIGY